MFNHQYFSAQYFPPVWFAPADESHLTPGELAPDTSQGIARGWLALEPVLDVTADASGYGARSGSGSAEAECGQLVVCVPSSNGARACSGRVLVSCSSEAGPRGYGAYARARASFAEASTSVVVAGAGSRSGSGVVFPSGDSAAHPRSCRAYAGGVVTLRCDAVKNPTDEEIIAWYLTRNA